MLSISPQFDHFVSNFELFVLMQHQTIRQQSVYHVVDVSLHINIAFLPQFDRHVEHNITSPLMPQLEFEIVVLHHKCPTFLNISKVCLLLLKYSEGSFAMRSHGLMLSRYLTMCQMSSMSAERGRYFSRSSSFWWFRRDGWPSGSPT